MLPPTLVSLPNTLVVTPVVEPAGTSAAVSSTASMLAAMGLGVVAHALTLAVSPPTVMLAALYKPLPEEPVHVLAALVPLTVKVTDTR